MTSIEQLRNPGNDGYKDTEERIEALREQGNVAWSLHNFDDAVSYYSRGINLDNTNYVLLSNRSAAFCKIGDYSSALEDAERVIKLKKDWTKGYIRKAEALNSMGRWMEASRTYEDGLRYDPKSLALREGRRNVLKNMSQPAKFPAGMKPSSLNLKKDSPFSRSDLMNLLKKDPVTREFLKDSVYVCLLDRMKKHPTDIAIVMSDQRLLTTLNILINLIEEKKSGEETVMKNLLYKSSESDTPKEGNETLLGDRDFAIPSMHSSLHKTEEKDNKLDFSFSENLFSKLHFSYELSDLLTPMGSKTKSDSRKVSKNKSLDTLKEEVLSDLPENSISDIKIEMSQSDLEKNENYKMEKAKEEKQNGNEAYRKKNFDTALDHYRNGIKMNPNDMTFYSNIAAVYFEKKEFEKCITECEIAIQIGTSNKASDELIAKAYLRISNAHRKLDNLYAAKLYCEKSLRIVPLSNAKSLLNVIGKEIQEMEKEAYKNPILAEQAFNRGNEYTEEGLFSEALKEYNEAIKRNSQMAVYFNNRAVCYFKLKEYDSALADCDRACQLDATKVDSWVNKGQILLEVREINEAIRAFDKALQIDNQCEDALNGFYKCIHDENPEGTKRKAMYKEDIQKIIFDPMMVEVMNEMKDKPETLPKYLKNKKIADKIKILQAHGLVDFTGG